MKNVFFIIDCSGSIVSDDIVRIGQVNDLLRDSIDKCTAKGAKSINVVCYSDNAKIFWKSSDKNIFCDIPDEEFKGRSNLGKAYVFLKKHIDASKLSLSDCVLALISDGEATDNYRRDLQILDPDNKAARIAFTIGATYLTTERHASDDSLLFKGGLKDRESFVDRLGDIV